MQAEMSKTKNEKRARKNRERRIRRREEKVTAAALTAAQRNLNANGGFKLNNYIQNAEWVLVGMHMWRQTYENAIKWHNEHQLNFWQQRAHQLQKENEYLRLERESSVQMQEEYETSDDDEDYEYNVEVNTSASEQLHVDEGYLEFMQITLKHREELKKAREQDQAIQTGEFL